MRLPDDFAVFILTHGRPDRVSTYSTLMRGGYAGRLYIIIDNEDRTADRYYEKFGDQVIMFDKYAVSRTFDEADNFGDRRSVVYARNASFEIAERLGIRYFMQLDDDYKDFAYKIGGSYNSIHGKRIRDLNKTFYYLLEYYKSIPAKSIAIAQGGDFMGGLENKIDKDIRRRRKCMNTFMLSTGRPFKFVCRINEDVTTYTWYQSTGALFLTFPLIAIEQERTQKGSGGDDGHIS